MAVAAEVAGGGGGGEGVTAVPCFRASFVVGPSWERNDGGSLLRLTAADVHRADNGRRHTPSVVSVSRFGLAVRR